MAVVIPLATGTFFARSLGGDIGAGGALLVAAVLMAIVAVITRVTHIAAARSGLYTVDPVSVGSRKSLPPKPDESHAALEGAMLVLRSKYLLSIVGIRAFTNMFMQRFAKGVSILTSMGLLALGVDIQHMSWLTIATALGMIVCSVYAGLRFAGRAEQPATPKPAVSLA